MSSSKRPYSFTLVELMVVVVIITILTSLLIPVLTVARRRARQSTCKSNLKQLATALETFGIDNDGYAPRNYEALMGAAIYEFPAAPENTPSSKSKDAPWTYWLWHEGHIGSDERILVCPGRGTEERQIFSSPAQAHLSSYGMNSGLNNGWDLIPVGLRPFIAQRLKRAEAFANPSYSIGISDALSCFLSETNGDYNQIYGYHGDNTTGIANMAFLDGHVAGMWKIQTSQDDIAQFKMEPDRIADKRDVWYIGGTAKKPTPFGWE